VTVDQEASASSFAGDLLLRLAAEGRLVLRPDVADQTISSLQDTLSQVHDRLRMLANTRTSDSATKAWFTQAAHELPKYIEAVRRARR
jgi:hypothetical protein